MNGLAWMGDGDGSPDFAPIHPSLWHVFIEGLLCALAHGTTDIVKNTAVMQLSRREISQHPER